MDSKLLKFSIDPTNISIEELSDSQLAIAEVKVVRSGMNTHKLPVDKEGLKESAKTLHNKFLVAGFNGYDFKGHEKDEKIIGYFPKEFEMEFVEENGEIFLKATAIISKHYANWAIDALKEIHRGKASVSMEAIVTKSEKREDGFEWITEFCFIGVTVLGRKVNPSSSGSEINVINFSEQEFIESTKQLWDTYLGQKNDFWNQSHNLSSYLERISSFSEKEEKMKIEDLKNEQEQINFEDEQVKEEDKVEMEDLKDEKLQMEDDKVQMEDDEQKEEDKEDEGVEMASETDAKQEEVEMQVIDEEKTVLCEKFEELKVKFEAMEVEFTRLKEFEAEVLAERENQAKVEMTRKIEFTCQELSEDLPQEKVEEWKNKIVEFSNIDAWANAFKADAYTYTKQNKQNEKPVSNTHIRMGLTNVFEATKEKSLWSVK